jgi:hypothetical protein
MSIVQPENLLAKDGTITADSFDKLAVKLAGTTQSAEVPAFREAQSPGIVATAE